MEISGNKTEYIKDKARELGFDLCGIAPAGPLKYNEEILRNWVSKGMNAAMEYMARDIEKRADPSKLLPGAKSVIVTGLNYYTEKKQGGGDIPSLSIYAYGKDYHEVIMERLNKLVEYIGQLDKDAFSRGFVDSSPILEKAWASRAGIGWQGKHSVLINNKIGSFFFLGIVLTNLELDYDQPARDNCGSCHLCIDACPVSAINDNNTIDARKCIAYLTINNKAPVDEADAAKLDGMIIGCDRCQEVCPWNRKALPHGHPEFDIPDEIRRMSANDWLNLSKEDFIRLFASSPLKQRKYDVFIKNVTNVTKFLKVNPGCRQ
ncbi:MAG TPA: tRNA epoxyqueuosine(34) reductase QueG [Bacteroidales bacterium]|nr:tRNA epoxyqueuosine(34) reductase QueG [Bacteroidales bacterium]